jgi:CelD/BcsL family acetyltransferase involved in cellulose biosynthesis
MTYSVEISTGLDVEAATRLWDGAATASVFNHPGWWQAAIDAFGANRALRICWVRTGAGTTLAPIAVFAFWLKTLGLRETFARVIEPVGARVTDYVTPIIAPGHDRAAVTRAAITAVADDLGPHTLLIWPKGDRRFGLEALARQRGWNMHTKRRPCAAASLPDTLEELELSWSKRLRGDVRRQTRRLAEFGQLDLQVAETRDDVLSRLPNLIDMHVRNWSERRGVSELSPGSPMVDFLTGIATRLPADLLHFSELTLENRPISAHFGFRQGRSLLWYKPAFDLAWQLYSPGKMHLALACQWAVKHNFNELDFLQGNEPYKSEWATHERATVTTTLSKPLAYPVWAWNTKVRRMAAEYRY